MKTPDICPKICSLEWLFYRNFAIFAIHNHQAMLHRLLRTAAVLLCAAIIAPGAAGWGRMGHSTVAKIAQNHLTKTTREKVNEILHGQSMTGLASYCDDYRADVDATFSPEWAQGVPHAHTFEVDENNRPFPVLKHPETGRGLTNCVYFADHCIQDLSHAQDFPDSTQWKALVMTIHLLGDMHCPGHIRYAARHKDIGKFDVTFVGEETNYHKVWDYYMVVGPLPFSFSDIAEICDDCTPEQMAEIVKGTIYDWGKDNADRCECVRLDAVSEGDKLNGFWQRDHTELTRIQLRNGGYRLAHALNMAFDPKYARKFNRKYNK